MTVLAENEGLITQIIGPVIDVEFSNGNLPEIYDALEIYSQDGQKTVAEVQQLLGENKVRSVAMSSTDGLQRGMKVINTKAPISIVLVTVPSYVSPTTGSNTMASMIAFALSALSRSTAAIYTVPSSLISIFAPVSATIF